MAPNTILNKMRMGVGTAGILLSMGYAESALTAEKSCQPAPKKPTQQKGASSSLSDAQLKSVRLSISQLDHDKFETRQNAIKTIRTLGKPTLKILRDALKTAKTLQLKSNLNKLIVELSPKPAPKPNPRFACGPCGRG